MKQYRKRASALFCLLALGLCACAGQDDQPLTDTPVSVNTADGETGTEEAETEPLYQFPAVDYGGYTFRILNADDIYSMHARIDFDGLTGEALNDAMYERCRETEQRLNIVIEETNMGVDNEVLAQANKVLRSGDDAYDAIYTPSRDVYKLVSQNGLYNLFDYDALQLDRPWWIQTYNDAIVVNGSLYGAAGYSQLMVMDSLWCLYFNEDMMRNLDLTAPYDLVRDGKWTADRLSEYCKAAANLNGDASFTFDVGGSCVWGISYDGIDRTMFGFGEPVLRAENQTLKLTCGSERYITGFEKILDVFAAAGGEAKPQQSGLSDDTPGSYINIFEVERALFMTAEISKTARLRNKDFNFGIVPYPKLDETQERYYSMPFYGTPLYTIPVTVSDVERSAVVGDVMTYISYEKVLPVFREVTLEQKGLRNEDSIEMLDLIIRVSTPNLMYVFNIGTQFVDEINKSAYTGENNVASTFAKYESKMQTAIEEINENYG